MTKRAVRHLVETRKELGLSTKVYVMALVSESVVGKLDAFYELVLRDLGADKMKLNLLQPSFGHGGSAGPDHFFANERIADVPRFLEELRRTDEKWAIPRNPTWLHQVEMYLYALRRGPRANLGWSAHAQTPEHICNTYERNVMVDIYGNLRLCFSPTFPTRRWSRPGDLARFRSVDGEAIARRMRLCNRYCGISHSVRREPATLPLEGAS